MADNLIQQMLNWYDANMRKNKAQSEERKSLEQAEKAYGQRNDTFVHKVDDTLELEAGRFTEESEEIDPKKFYEKYPEHFWDVCSIPKGNAEAVVGKKGVALCSRTVKKTGFKIRKKKLSVNGD